MATKRLKTKKVDLTAVQKELLLAYKRINGTSIRRLQWLLDFACYSELDSMSEGQRGDLAWEVVAFGVNGRPKEEDIRKFLDDLRGVVSTFQRYMKAVFDSMYSGLPWEFTYPRKTKLISIPHIQQGDEGAYGDWSDLDADELLRVQAFELVEAEANRLRVCENPKCPRPRFVATKKGLSRFHSTTCSAYVRIRKSRGKPA